MKKSMAIGLTVGVCSAFIFLFSQAQVEKINLLSLQQGTFPIIEPASYNGWSTTSLLDDSSESGWACEEGKISGNTFVFELVVPATLERFEFDTGNVDEEGAGAREVTVEVSSVSGTSAFAIVLQASLAPKADNQIFKAMKSISGRWVRLTIRSNHGNTDWTELFTFRGYGAKGAAPSPLGNISGTYDTDYSEFHVRQQGTALQGCYEQNDGLLDGVIEGRLMKITWREGTEGIGPAVMVFAPDGKSFRGYWWRKDQEKLAPGGAWNGKKIADAVGGCPHWSGSLGGELKKQLTRDGRARVYGILFDLNSAVIRPESNPVLDDVLKLLQSESSWKLTIEGHTDSSGGDAINQPLSLKRADAVKAYLVAAGIDSTRLQTKGYGASKPVADNATELGRAQNRRVELIR